VKPSHTERKVQVILAIALAAFAFLGVASWLEIDVMGRDAGTGSPLAHVAIAGGWLLACAVVGFTLLAVRRDFAGRRRAEAELERFFSLSLDFLCISSADGYFKRVSPAVTDILGWTQAEFLARPFLDFVHPEDHAATLAEVDKQVRAGEKVLHFENRYLHRDGSWRVLSWRSMPQPDGLMYATARDVTPVKEAERELREVNERLEARVRERTAELARANESLESRERRFRAMIERGSDSIALIDGDNKVLYLSPAVATVEGYSPEELLGHSGIEHTHPEDLPLVARAVEQLVANPGVPIPVMWRRKHKDGRWIWLEGVATNLLADPAVGAIVTNYRDVTARIQGEAKLRTQLARLALLSHITRAIGERQDARSIFQVVVRTLEAELPVDFCGICLYDRTQSDITVASVGPASASLAAALDMREQARIPIDENGLSRCVRGQLVYEPDVTAISFPFPQRLTQGGLRSLVAAPLLVEKEVFGVLMVARFAVQGFGSDDCEFLRQLSEHVGLATHQTQLRAALQKAYDDLHQTQQAVMQQERLRALGQMASGIAHDINNAISPITLYADSLLEREPGLSDRARDHLGAIQRAIGDVAQTVTRMREFYRPREPQLTLAPVQLNALAQQVLDLTRARWSDMAQRRGVAISVRTDLAPDLPEIRGAESELRDALTNLILNAADAMVEGGTLTIRTMCSAHAPRRVGSAPDVGRICLEVSDTGVGMDEDTRRRCLEPFFTTKGERGTGLGLAMVYGAVQRHSGELEIESAPGKGTTVRLSFAAPDTRPAVAEEPRPAAVPAARRILIVDDDPILLETLRDILEADGHGVVAMHGGQAGIDAFRAAHGQGESPHVVITDLGMPNVDGRKVAAAVKTQSPATPVILLTGWGHRLLAEGDIPPHVDRVLSKPPRLRELRDALAAIDGESGAV
jgi:PAS domain S-box-containing protein